MTNTNGRALPADINAERATLGSILLERDAIIAVASWLTADAFYLEKHAWIYEAMLACMRRRVPPDTPTVADELRRQDRLDPVGGLAYLMSLNDATPTAVHVEYYGRIVERCATLRNIITVGGKVTALGYDETEELEVTLDKVEQAVFAITQRRVQRDYRHISEGMDALYTWLDQVAQGGGAAQGVPTGYPDLDGLLSGLHSSDLIILAARPGMGKTSLALSIALNVAGAGGNVGIVSLEMSEQQLLQRLVCMDTGIDLQKFRSGKLAQPEIVQSLDAMGRLSNANIHIDDEAGQNIGSIRAKARNLHTHNRLDLLIVDYLQLGDGSDASRRQANRIQQVDEISRGLKALARELDCPLLALSQLSRAVEGRTSRVPQLSDLRESGQLEADADVVMFIYREEVYDKHTTKTGIAEVYIAKQRNGPLGMASLHFDKRTTRFKSLSNQVYAGNGVHP